MTTPPPAPTLPPDLLAKATGAIKAYATSESGRDTDVYFDADNIARIALRAVDVLGLMAEIEQLRTEQADNLRAAQSIAAELVAQREEAREALAECEDKLDDIINCMGGDECSGWDAPEDVWELAQKGRTIARRVLGKEAE